MTEHLIRLRGGWEWMALEAAPEPRRITLPTVWPQDLPGPFRMVRRFGCPSVDSERESVCLRMQSVAGLKNVWLNDQPILPKPADDKLVELLVDESLRARNELILEVDPSSWKGAPERESPWGSIVLVIRPR